MIKNPFAFAYFSVFLIFIALKCSIFFHWNLNLAFQRIYKNYSFVALNILIVAIIFNTIIIFKLSTAAAVATSITVSAMRIKIIKVNYYLLLLLERVNFIC